MMYTNFFLFIVAITVFATAPEGGAENTTIALAAILLLPVFFWEWNRQRFLHLALRWRETGESFSFARRAHQQAVSLHSFLALGLFVLVVVVFRVKPLFMSIPGIGRSTLMVHLLGLGFFFTLLASTWYWSWRATDGSMSAAPSGIAHARSQLRFNLVIVIPWLLLSAAVDLWRLLRLPASPLLDSSLAQLVFFALFILLLILFTPLLMTRLWDCAPLDDRELHDRIENFCRSRGVRFRGILSWNAMHRGLLTAGVVGLIPPLRFLLITPALIRLLNEDELIAVVSHEIGHVRRRHLWLYLLFFGGFVVVSLAIMDRAVAWIVGSVPGLALLITPEGGLNAAMLGWLTAFVSLLLFVLYFRFVFGWFMRNFERQADLFCFQAGVIPGHMMSALEKLRLHTGESSGKGNWHHYSLTQRVAFLRRCQSEPRLVKKHDLKLKGALSIFIVFLMVFSLFAFRSGGVSHSGISLPRLTRAVALRLEKEPSNPALLSLMGTLLYEQKNWHGAANAYRRSLASQYRQPDTLNNYAWLLVTCPEKELRDPRQALRFSMDAAALKRTHYILDTLAVVLLANGKADEAVRASREALALAPENLEYYRKQLQRMRMEALRVRARTI